MNEDSAETEQRIDSLVTNWSLLIEAHRNPEDSVIVQQAVQARQTLLHRYRKPIYRYVLACTNDRDATDDILQKFALVILEGKLHRANPSRGRFRKYVKTVVLNLIRDHIAESGGVSLPAHLVDESAQADSNQQFADGWRSTLLERAMQQLEKMKPTQFRVLSLSVQFSDVSSKELAIIFVDKYKQSMNGANIRKTLQRAYQSYGDCVVHQVAASIENPTPESVSSELSDLRLQSQCADAFQRWFAKQTS